MSEPMPAASPQQPMTESEARQWAGLAHLLGGIFILIAPLVIWLVFKDRNAYLDAEAKKALNWSIWVTIGLFVSYVLLSWLILGFITGPLIQVLALVYGIVNFTYVNSGKPTSYIINTPIIK